MEKHEHQKSACYMNKPTLTIYVLQTARLLWPYKNAKKQHIQNLLSGFQNRMQILWLYVLLSVHNRAQNRLNTEQILSHRYSGQTGAQRHPGNDSFQETLIHIGNWLMQYLNLRGEVFRWVDHGRLKNQLLLRIQAVETLTQQEIIPYCTQ